MEIVIAAAVCTWITFFAVWAYLKVRKDFHDEMETSENGQKSGKDTVR